MEKLLRSFLKKLTNLNSNNRSVCLLKAYREQFFDLHRLDFLYKLPSFHIIEQLVSGKKKCFLCDEIDPRDEIVNEISRNIKNIFRKDKSLFEETGAKDLFIGWPFVRGKFSDGTPVRCPLLFFPVRLELQSGKWYIEQRTDNDISFNKSFLLSYSHFNKIKISDEWMDSLFEEYVGEALSFRTKLYELLKVGPVELNFNQDLFTDKLIPFKEYTSEDYLGQHKNGELKLFSEAVLGIFPQAASYLVPDYKELIERKEYSDLEDFFASKSQCLNINKNKEEHTYIVFPTDASQEEALLKVKEGKSLVVQGPPGTGKSQLICNLISDFVSRGKKVAVVCKKKAALDVLHQRLSSKNVEAFCGIVHDYKNDRSRLFQQIRTQIEKLEEYEKQNNGLDTIYLERMFLQASRQIQQTGEELQEFKKALFTTEDFGISPKELYLTSNPKAKVFPMKEFAAKFNLESSLNFERRIKNYYPYASRFLIKGYIWADRISFADFFHRDKQVLIDTILKIPVYQKQLEESAKRQLKDSFDNYPFDFFLRNKNVAESIGNLMKDEEDFYLLLDYLKGKEKKEWLEERRLKINLIFKKSSPEITLSVTELDICESKIHRYLASKVNFLTSIFWNLFSGDRVYLKEVLRKNDLTLHPDNALILSKRIIARKKLEKEKFILQKKSIFSSFPSNFQPTQIESWFERNFRIIDVKEIIISSPDIYKIVGDSVNEFKVFSENIQLIPLLAKDIEDNFKQWQVYIMPSMIEQLLKEKIDIKELVELLDNDFDSLVEFDKIQKELLAFEKQIMFTVFQQFHENSVEDKIELFRNSLRLEWISLLEEKYPVLRIVSNLRIELLEKTLQDAVADKYGVCRDIVQLKLREGCYKNIEYNRLQNRITYRELYHQVTKKKKIWSIRKLLNDFYKEIFSLIPCWLVSPESASALFPLQEMFDLVIFDEASQCFSEQGLPAMYRGKQVVVVGDSMQLKPNDLYQIRWEEEEDENPDNEIDSLLELSEKYLPSTHLTGHYRSNNLALIDFSNRYFYSGSLELIPEFSEINSSKRPIEYISVNGLWENNTNSEEADKVVNIVLELLKKDTENSIGIVTFNFKQTQLILDLLEKESINKNIVIPESLFVKNIENVQGDERDIILFSIGYAPDKKGKFWMNFGSLNQDGGENRLNVAVTRARKKVYLVVSIQPQQLNVEESLHNGPKLLKKYLEYAWQVSKGEYIPVPVQSGIEHKEWYLSKKIIDRCSSSELSIMEELPFADLTIKNKGTYQSLLFLDDYLYFRARSVKEIHSYKMVEIRKKGWEGKRVYSREYWLHQNNFKEYINSKLI